MKKLPSIFKNDLNKTFDTNMVYSKISDNLDRNDKDVLKTINSIFTSNNYIYKADVEIKLKDKTINKRIIGKNKNYLITIDNELIPIQEILDIKKS